MKRKLIYLSIISANFILLRFLFRRALDTVDVIQGKVEWEFLKIPGITLLIAAYSILKWWNTKGRMRDFSKRVVMISILTFCLSAYFYGSYTLLFVQRTNDVDRQSLLHKIEAPSPVLPDFRSINGDSLEYVEYSILERETWFPKVPKEARNLSFGYAYGTFLQADWNFTLIYDLPLEVPINEKPKEGDDMGYSKEQRVEIFDDFKRVTYGEGQM